MSAKKPANLLDVEPWTRPDAEFRRAYRSNLGRKVEGELLRKASSEYLGDLLACDLDQGLRLRIEQILDKRELSSSNSRWGRVKALLRMKLE